MTRTMPNRRDFLASTAALAAFGARAQGSFPAAPIRVVIPFAAGGATDVLGRDIVRKESAVWDKVIRDANIPLN